MTVPGPDAIAAPPAERALVSRFGSPLYVYSAGRVREELARLRAAFPYPDLDVHYAIVCNKNPYLVRLLTSLGTGIHANTPGDAHAALAAGVPAGRIVYSGTNLTSVDLEYLVSRGISLNLDSLDQLRDALDARARLSVPTSEGALGLRLLVDEAETGNRIGVLRSELPEAVRMAGEAGLRLSALHVYVGTNTRSVERFLSGVDRLIEASEELPDLESLDLGGGYGVGYREGTAGLDLAELGRGAALRMEELSRRRGRPIRLVLEPGRLLVASSGSLLTTVVSVKERGGRRFVGVDSTVGNLVVPSVYHEHHRIAAVEPRGPELDVPTDVCGSTTHSRDFLGRSHRLPELRKGDLLAVLDVGAYGYAMSSHFLNRPRPAEVVVDGGDPILTTRRETMDDLLSTWSVPG
jgi:diaminopimelate decarboxylase